MAELPFFAEEEGRGQFLALLFFISAAVITLWGTWAGTLPASEEAVLAETAREILTSGNVSVLRFDGEPVYDTPPLGPWLMAGLYLILGVNAFAARLAFVLLAVVSYYLMYLAGREVSRDWSTVGGVGTPAGGSPDAGAGNRVAGTGGASGAAECADRHGHWGSLPTAVGVLAAVIFASTPLLGKFAPHITVGLPFTFCILLALLGWLYLPRGGRGHILWAAGIAGCILSAWSGALFIILGALVASAIDATRRVLLKEPRFWIATAVGIALGGLWLFPAAARSGEGFFANPLWASLARWIHFPAGASALALDSARSIFLRGLPWSIPSTIAAVKIVFLRSARRRSAAVGTIDGALLAFAVLVCAPLAIDGRSRPSLYLPVVPFLSLLAAREIARWLRHRGADPAKHIWALNRGITALFCLLMLLVVATPLNLHSTSVDPIEEVARMAQRLAPAGERIGNFRMRGREQRAQMLFYGSRSLEYPMTESGEVAAALRANPSKVFLSSSAGVEALRASEDFPYEIRLLHGAGDLVLFGMREPCAREAP